MNTRDSVVRTKSGSSKTKRGGKKNSDSISNLANALGALSGPSSPSKDQDTAFGTIDSRAMKTKTRKVRRGGKRPGPE